MTSMDLTAMTKKQLLVLARERKIVGRSTMSKAQLLVALAGAPEQGSRADSSQDTPPESESQSSSDSVDEPSFAFALPGISPADRASARAKRAALHERLSKFVDVDTHCAWQSSDGHPCGLPIVVGSRACGLHGDGTVFDRAVPLTGHLGFSAWPRLWRQLALATYDTDIFGLDPVIAEMAWHMINMLYFDYFRVEVEGIENVPTDGGAVLVANHGGAALPYDAAMLSLTVMNEAEIPRRVRVVGTEIFNMLPAVSHLYRKVGAAYAAREDAKELLARGHLLGVFPEGERGFMKPVWDAYNVGRLGRGGFAEMAQEASVPIVPVAIVGSEEVHPTVFVSKRLASLVKLVFPEQRLDAVAVALNPIPLPIRWRIRFLPPIEPSTGGRELDSLDQLERAEDIRATIQAALDDILSTRRTAF